MTSICRCSPSLTWFSIGVTCRRQFGLPRTCRMPAYCNQDRGPSVAIFGQGQKPRFRSFLIEPPAASRPSARTPRKASIVRFALSFRLRRAHLKTNQRSALRFLPARCARWNHTPPATPELDHPIVRVLRVLESAGGVARRKRSAA
jgi:hypothetical protein